MKELGPPKPKATDKVFELLKARRFATTSELAAELGLSRDTVGTSLGELRGEGLAVRGCDPGLWIISEVVERDLREQQNHQEARA